MGVLHYAMSGERGPASGGAASTMTAVEPTNGVPVSEDADGRDRHDGSSWPMWVLGLVIMIDQVDQNIVRGVATPLQGGLRPERPAGRHPAVVVHRGERARQRARRLPRRPLEPHPHDRPHGRRLVGHHRPDRGGVELPVAARHPLRARVRAGDHRAVGREPARRLLPARAAGPRLLHPAVPGVRRLRPRHRPRWRWWARRSGGGGRSSSSARPACSSPARVYRLQGAAAGSRRPPAPRPRGRRATTAPRSSTTALFDEGFGAFLRDMVARPARGPARSILAIPTMRYALVGVSSLLFTVTAVAAALPQFYERSLGVEQGQAELYVGALIISAASPACCSADGSPTAP